MIPFYRPAAACVSGFVTPLISKRMIAGTMYTQYFWRKLLLSISPFSRIFFSLSSFWMKLSVSACGADSIFFRFTTVLNSLTFPRLNDSQSSVVPSRLTVFSLIPSTALLWSKFIVIKSCSWLAIKWHAFTELKNVRLMPSELTMSAFRR